MKTAAITSITVTALLLGLTGCATEPEVELPAPVVSTAEPSTEQPSSPEAEETTTESPTETSNSSDSLSDSDISEPDSNVPLNDTPVPAGTTVQTDIAYHTATTANGNVELQLDLYSPASADGTPIIVNQPAVLLIHGGAFIIGNKNMSNMENWATQLADNGYVVANINYRLLPSDPVVSDTKIINYLLNADPTAALPLGAPEESIDALRIGLGAALEDANAALTWLAAQGVDTNSIAIAGESAGAITALHLAYLNDTLQLNPITPAAILNLYGAMSQPTAGGTEITAAEPPLWTLHGTNDFVVPYAAAEYLEEQTNNAGIPHVLHTATGKAHGFSSVGFFTGTTSDGTAYINDQINFLKTYLGK